MSTTVEKLPRPSPGSYGDLKAEVRVVPANYCMGGHESCRACPERPANHGRSTAVIWFILSGHDLAVALSVDTGWLHPLDPKFRSLHSPSFYGGRALSMHSSRPWYDEQAAPDLGQCDMLDETEFCYSDVAYLESDTGLEILCAEGSEGVWQWLSEKFSQLLQERSEYER